MISRRRILCPIDFSDVSRRALDYAVALARWSECAITILQVEDGRGALDPAFFGSTAHHVVRAASCPVLTLRAPEPAA